MVVDLSARDAVLARDRYRERRWLESVVTNVPSKFAAHARERLEMGEGLYGARWATMGIARLLDELAEEAVDLGAWSALALQALDGEDLAPSLRDEIVAQLRAAACAGAQAHAAVEAGVRALERARSASAAVAPNADPACPAPRR